jgi:hypothetical protein
VQQEEISRSQQVWTLAPLPQEVGAIFSVGFAKQGLQPLGVSRVMPIHIFNE